MTPFDVVGLGMATIDILTVVPRLPDSNDVYPIDSITVQGGGPVATALVALAKLGAETTYLGTIAPDDWGVQITQDFQRFGVDAGWAYRPETGGSSVSVILVESGSGHRSILYQPGTAPEMTAAEVRPEAFANAKILHLDGFYLEAALEAARLARSQDVFVSLDGGAGENIWQGMEQLLPLVDILVVARQFANSATGETNPLVAGPALKKHGASQVVITDGENGCWYWDAQQHIYQPAFKVDVVDTTGAGDTFHGAYLYAILQDWGLEQCLAFASATAALKCTQVGGRAGIPSLEQVLDFLEMAN
jgi:sulfofructose kinase